MKRVMCFLILAIGWLGLSGQTEKFNNKGAWFVFQNRQYDITIDDVVEISKGAHKMVAWKSYHLSNGEKFVPINSQLWEKKLTGIITKIDGVKPTNLAECLSQGTIVSWTDDISGKITNYGVDENGDEFVADANFKGKDDFKGLNYKGYIILKLYEPCVNVLEPDNIITSVPVPVPVSKPKEEAKEFREKEKEAGLPKDIGGGKEETFVPCTIASYTATPNTIKSGETVTLTWVTENTSSVSIDGIGSNLFSTGSAQASITFGRKEKSISFPLSAFDMNGKLCKTMTVDVFRMPKSSGLFKKVPNWIEGTAGGLLLAGATGFLFPGDGIWYGLGGKNPIIAEAGFNPVDALPQARLPQKRGINPNLMVAFHF